MAFTVGFMWFWEEREKARDEITTDFKERKKEKGQDGCRWMCMPSFFYRTRQEQECRWLAVTSHHKRTKLNPLFFVGRAAIWLLGRSDIYTGVKTLPNN